MSSQNFTKTRDAARGKWRGILIHFGIDEACLRNIHGPCPICKGKDRFRFDDHEGEGTYYCSQCEPGTGMRLLMEFKGWTFPKAAAEVDAIVGNLKVQGPKSAPTVDNRAVMLRMYRESAPIAPGDPAWLYLESRCGNLHLHREVGLIHLGELRFHPGLKHSVDGGIHPAMLALMRPSNGPKAIGIHRTFLALDGRKAAVDPVRMSFGEVAPVPLGPASEVIGIAEGIETAICAAKRFGIPTWAAICANGLKAFDPPEGVRTVVIFGDNDRSLTGQEAAYSLGRRLVTAGYEVDIHIPPHIGTDWADMPTEQVA